MENKRISLSPKARKRRKEAKAKKKEENKTQNITTASLPKRARSAGGIGNVSPSGQITRRRTGKSNNRFKLD